jgi:metal-responsive CopG/Arc/MetJ family transcriptional regulator
MRYGFMRTIQMTLEDDLVRAVDKIVKQMHTTRSAFTRKALRDAITNYKLSHLEQKHRKGYEKQPVSKEEFSAWEDEQKWGDS